MNARTISYRRTSILAIVLLAAALALAALIGFCNIQRAAAAEQPTVELTLVAEQGWDSPWFNAGSPVLGAFASNSDGAYITGIGTATRMSDGFTWTLSITNSQFLAPLTDQFIFQNNAVSETWQIAVGEVLTETRNDAWFETSEIIPSTPAYAHEPITLVMTITNVGSITGNVKCL